MLTCLSSSRTGQPVLEPGSLFQNRAGMLSGSGTGQSSRLGQNIDIYTSWPYIATGPVGPVKKGK